MTGLCPCGSKTSYKKCCEPFHSGRQKPPTAEKLMRSRYCAYALGKVSYVVNTSAKDLKEKLSLREIMEYCKHLKCISLKILETAEGGESDVRGVVRFQAEMAVKGEAFLQEERSLFERESGVWVYSGIDKPGKNG